MKTGIRLFTIIIILVLLLVVGVSLTQARHTGNDLLSTITSHPAILPWYGEFVDISPNLTHVGTFTSLALRPGDDYPMISYYDQTNGALMVAGPTEPGHGSCGENADWNCTTSDQIGDVGQYTSIDIWGESLDNMKLGISYFDATNRSLKARIISCVDGDCTGGNVTISSPVYAYMSVGLYTSLKFDPTGTPHIAYQAISDTNYNSLRYASYVGSGGNCGEGTDTGKWQCEIIDFGIGIGQYISLDLTYDGAAYLSYYDAGLGNLKMAYYTGFADPDCFSENGWVCPILDSVGDVGLYTSITAQHTYTDKLYRIAYYDKTNGHLKYYDSEFGPVIVDDMGTSSSPMGVSMDVDNEGFPVIAYQQITSEFSSPTLNIARPFLAFDDDIFGNCGDVPPGYFFQYWRCTILDNAGQNLSEAEFVSVVVNSFGLTQIAYSEFYGYDQGENSTSLKFITQRFQSFLPLLHRH
jgi:hypothetical protein